MYRTRQQFPSFMGVYIPPCSNVESSVNICISNVTTVRTTEVLAVPNANVTAFMASLRSICRRDGDNLNAIHLTLVFKERTELIEVPGITSPTKSFVAAAHYVNAKDRGYDKDLAFHVFMDCAIFYVEYLENKKLKQ